MNKIIFIFLLSVSPLFSFSNELNKKIVDDVISKYPADFAQLIMPRIDILYRGLEEPSTWLPADEKNQIYYPIILQGFCPSVIAEKVSYLKTYVVSDNYPDLDHFIYILGVVSYYTLRLADPINTKPSLGEIDVNHIYNNMMELNSKIDRGDEIFDIKIAMSRSALFSNRYYNKFLNKDKKTLQIIYDHAVKDLMCVWAHAFKVSPEIIIRIHNEKKGLSKIWNRSVQGGILILGAVLLIVLAFMGTEQGQGKLLYQKLDLRMKILRRKILGVKRDTLIPVKKTEDSSEVNSEEQELLNAIRSGAEQAELDRGLKDAGSVSTEQQVVVNDSLSSKNISVSEKIEQDLDTRKENKVENSLSELDKLFEE